MSGIVEKMRVCENDPMWADHAEVPKAWCKAAADEIERLHERLEDNHVFELVDGVMTRVAVEPGSIPDGIDCRDETIKGLREQIAMLKAKISNLEGQIAYRDGIAQI